MEADNPHYRHKMLLLPIQRLQHRAGVQSPDVGAMYACGLEGTREQTRSRGTLDVHV